MTNLEMHIDDIAKIIYRTLLVDEMADSTDRNRLIYFLSCYFTSDDLNDEKTIVNEIKDYLLTRQKEEYKLTQFEFDLLRICNPYEYCRNDITLTSMQNYGYFKDIPTDISIEKILENCEVIDKNDE